MLKLIQRIDGRNGIYLCSCGREIKIMHSNARVGQKYCRDCFKAKPPSQLSHGLSRSNEYYIWQSMKDRCNNANSEHYKCYGQRNINVCQLWNYYFEEFYKDMGPRPSKKHSIDRIDNDGNYCKNNCRWTTSKIQSRNTRKNVKYIINNQEKCIREICEEYHINECTFKQRINKGMSPIEAVSKPVKKYKKRSYG